MQDSNPTRRPRISLRTLLLSVAIIAIGLAILRFTFELVPLRQEVLKLRAETGQLTIDDPDKIHAIQMVTDYPLAWKWRVYIPAGRKVHLHHQNSRISKAGVPKMRGGSPLVGPLEFVVTVKLDKQPDGRWRSGISRDGQTTYRIVPEDATTWLTKGSSGSQFRQVTRAVTVEEVGKPLVLLRKRVFYNAGGQILPAVEPDQADGLLVWLAD